QLLAGAPAGAARRGAARSADRVRGDPAVVQGRPRLPAPADLRPLPHRDRGHHRGLEPGRHEPAPAAPPARRRRPRHHLLSEVPALRDGGGRSAPAGRHRGGAAPRRRPEPGGAGLARGLGGGHLRGHGGRAAGAAAGPLRHPMSRPWLGILAAVFLLPVFVRHTIATEIWIFAIFGLGLNLLMGYTGLLSFGQATFFGSAAYAAGYLLKYYGINIFLALALGIAVGAVGAALVGYLCVQRSGLYFIMLTFALNQMFYFTAYQWTTVTGGEDGMPGVPRPSVLGLDIHPPL